MKNLFGAILQELRKDHKITQKDLADILGVTSKTISNYETGSQFPDLLIIINPFNFRLVAGPTYSRSDSGSGQAIWR